MSITLILFGLSYVKSNGLEKKMNKIDLETYKWTKRLLVINLKSGNEEKISYIDNWLISYKCKIEERNINIVFFEDYKNKQYKKPLFLKNFGFWLIGYDGEVKTFSLEKKILYEIFNLIDQMPIRKQEMLMHKTKC
ncbi:MAG: DUF4174 domain-containing protein [Paracoccaceae bacterium]